MTARTELRRAGAQLANAAYNLARRKGDSLTTDDCERLDQLHIGWDKASRELDAEDDLHKPDGYRIRVFDKVKGEWGDWFQTDKYFYDMWKASGNKDMEVVRVYYERRASPTEPDLLALLAHAVNRADAWHDDSHGGQAPDDEKLERARKLTSHLRKE